MQYIIADVACSPPANRKKFATLATKAVLMLGMGSICQEMYGDASSALKTSPGRLVDVACRNWGHDARPSSYSTKCSRCSIVASVVVLDRYGVAIVARGDQKVKYACTM